MALEKNMGSNLAVKFGYIQTYIAGGEIWRGGLVVLRLATATDMVYAAEDDPDDSLKQLVLGFAMEAAVVEAAIRVRQDGKYRLEFPSIPPSVIGRLACLATPAAPIVSNDCVQLYGALTCKVVVGRITEKPSSTHVFVDLGDRPSRLASEYD